MISHHFNTISDIWKLGIKWNFHGKLWHIFIEYHTYILHNRNKNIKIAFCKKHFRFQKYIKEVAVTCVQIEAILNPVHDLKS